MYKRMLVPLDGSPLAAKVLPFAKQIGNNLKLEVIFLHVCGHGQSVSKFICESYIEHVAELSGTQLKARGDVARGDLAKAIITYAEKHDIDLLLLATHGQSGFGRWTTGSTAHKIVTTSKFPVLLVRPNISRNLITSIWPKTILVPLDGSPAAESVLPYVLALAQQGQTHPEVILLKICEGPDLLADYPEAIMSLTWQEHIKRVTAASQHTCGLYLDEVQERFRATGAKVHSEVILGDKDNVAPEIAAYASKRSCDLVAMSTHGRSGISDWPFGHVTDRLLRVASTPLFLIRPKTS